VAPTCRRHGVGTRLAEFCLARLKEARIRRCNIFVYTDNDAGNRFWLRNGWNDPPDWKVLQRPVCGDGER
jgi:putative acetyltransferase